MTRDYAEKKKKFKKSMRTRGSDSGSGKISKSLVINFNPMLVLVIVIGAIFIGTIFYLEYGKDFLNKTQKKMVVAKAQNHAVVKTKKEIISRMPKFEFYHTLPKMQVTVNDSKTKLEKLNNENNNKESAVNMVAEKQQEASVDKNIATLKNNQDTPIADNATGYTLQLASFKEFKDADELKVKLLLAGFDVYIQTVTLNNGDVWHRVKTNKLADIATAQDTSAKLRNYNIKSIVVVDRS